VIILERDRLDRIAFLILAEPADPVTPRWISSVEKCLSAGSEVHLYFVDRGVLHLAEDNFFALNRDDLKLYACAFGAIRYGVPRIEPVVFAGLTVLHNLVVGCGAFVSAAPSTGAEEGDWLLDRAFSKGRDRGGMIDDLVVSIRWNPRESHLPVEGLRIASGLTIADIPLRICLDRDAAPLLDLPADDVIDGDRRDDYLDILVRSGAAFHHEGDRAGNVRSGVESRHITGEEAREIVSTTDRLIVI